MGKMALTSCRALSTPGKFSNVDRYAVCVLNDSQNTDRLNPATGAVTEHLEHLVSENRAQSMVLVCSDVCLCRLLPSALTLKRLIEVRNRVWWSTSPVYVSPLTAQPLCTSTPLSRAYSLGRLYIIVGLPSHDGLISLRLMGCPSLHRIIH